MKKIISIVIVIIVIGAGAFFYFTRPVALPTEPVQNVSETLPTPTSQETRLYRISQDDSTAAFTLEEELNGNPFTPVGVTHQIAGDISITGNTVTMGTIMVNAKTLKTDSSNRDGAVNRFILKTEDPGNEYIQFAATDISGEPAVIENGKEFSLEIKGNLTISGVTKETTFFATMTVTDARVSGTVSGEVKRSDYNLKIPSVPSVANVSDDIGLSATIIATRVQQ